MYFRFCGWRPIFPQWSIELQRRHCNVVNELTPVLRGNWLRPVLHDGGVKNRRVCRARDTGGGVCDALVPCSGNVFTQTGCFNSCYQCSIVISGFDDFDNLKYTEKPHSRPCRLLHFPLYSFEVWLMTFNYELVLDRVKKNHIVIYLCWSLEGHLAWKVLPRHTPITDRLLYSAIRMVNNYWFTGTYYHGPFLG